MAFDPNCGFNGVDNHNTVDMRDELGAVYNVGDHSWMYVKAGAAIAAGQIVSPTVAAATVTNITAADNVGDRATGKYPSVTDSDLAATADAHIGSYLYLNSGTGAGQYKKIVANSTTQIWFEAVYPEMGEDDPFATAPVVNDDGVIISMFNVVKSPADSEVALVMGYAPYAFTTQYYGYIMCGGLGLPLSGTDNGALVAGKFVVPGDNTAGQCTGVTTSDDIFLGTPFGVALHAGADDQAAPVWIFPKR